MKEIKTSITIEADIQTVWDALVDFSSYPSWNPFVVKVDVSPSNKERIKVYIQAPQSKQMTFNAKILSFIPTKELVWKGAFLNMPFLFSGEHYFRLHSTEKNITTLVHGEIFKGCLLPLLKKQLDKNTRFGFGMMNRALKACLELS